MKTFADEVTMRATMYGCTELLALHIIGLEKKINDLTAKVKDLDSLIPVRYVTQVVDNTPEYNMRNQF